MSETMVKQKDVIVYRNEASYSHNAVVELLENGSMVAVVQEQKRRKYRTHIDPTSTAVLLRSDDGGQTWDPATKTVVATSPGQAINDPAIKRLQDGTLIVTFFKWQCGGGDQIPAQNTTVRGLDGEHYAWVVGSYVTRSFDDGQTWEEPIQVASPLGDGTCVSDPVIQVPSGELFIPVYGSHTGESDRVVVIQSSDGGASWGDPATVAYDPLGHFEFQEPSLLYLPSGKMICMIRVHQRAEQEYGDYLYQCDSYDMGKTWSAPKKTSIWGHPPHLLRLQSGALLCVYGYLRLPYGIRACLSHDEGESWDIQNELILRADGIDRDVGYPTSVQLADGTIFTIWYMCEPAPDMAHAGDWFGYNYPLGYIGGTFYREA